MIHKNRSHNVTTDYSERLTELLRTEGLSRVPAESADAGDIVAVAGIPDLMIGDTLADLDNPVPLPRIEVDQPAISVTVGTNTSPLAGRDPHPGAKLTARLVRNRLDAELVGNVSIKVLPTERPDTCARRYCACVSTTRQQRSGD
jgi:GTP-binding protein